jgi:hypothetical protein
MPSNSAWRAHLWNVKDSPTDANGTEAEGTDGAGMDGQCTTSSRSLTASKDSGLRPLGTDPAVVQFSILGAATGGVPLA